MRRRLTQRPKVAVAFRMPRDDRERWYVAAKLEGISQSEFLRGALRDRVERVLAAAATPVVR